MEISNSNLSLLKRINNYLISGQNNTLLALIKGFRNGAVYGAKVRFPHSLVMTFLFKRGKIQEMARGIAEATYQHSRNLACFVFAYKALTSVLEWLQSQKTHEFHSFVGAFIAGYFVFGRYNKVNEQINLYLFSRILYALAKLGTEKGYIPKSDSPVFPWFGATVWGIVLWLFEYHRHTLQPSLKHSMTYLYDDSKKWSSIKDFIIYNKMPAIKK